MPDNPARLPAEIRAGDTLTQTVTLTDYPASAGWALAYTLVGSSSVISIAASVSGDDFVVSKDSAATASWAAGVYQVQATVTLGADRYTVDAFPVRVLQNLAALSAGADLRTHARKVLDAIEAWLESRAPRAAVFQIEGRRLENHSIPDLLVLRDRYRAEVNREERAAAGFGASRILMRL